MRRIHPVAALAATAVLAAAPALLPAASAQTHHKAAAKADAAKPAADAGAAKTTQDPNPVIASVDGDPIRLNDVRAAAQSLPDDVRGLPPQMLFPLVVNQLVDQKALLIEAHKQNLQKSPDVQAEMQQAADTALQNALLKRAVSPKITDQALHDAYNKDYANKPGEAEVHARHILVPTEAAANDVIKKLKGGADFATLAKEQSTDKGSAQQNGGDLGWFKKGDMLPEFSAAAFGMKKGEISEKPVHTQYGWHVIQVLDTRTAPTPSFDSVRDQIKQKLIQQDVRDVVMGAVKQVKVVHYKPDGSVQKDNAPATPPAAAGAPSLPAPPPPAPGASGND